MSKPSTHISVNRRTSEFINDKTSAEKVAAEFISNRDISRTSSLHKPCTESDRKEILSDVALLKSLIKDENDRKKSGDDILGTIAIGELYEDKAVKTSGELLENKVKELRRITARLRRRNGFKNFLKNKSIKKMVPKTVDELLQELPTDHEFMCIVDPTLRYKSLKLKDSSKKPNNSGSLIPEELNAFYQNEQQFGRHRGGKHKRKTNKRKTRRY
jgi:hypothetical protein